MLPKLRTKAQSKAAVMTTSFLSADDRTNRIVDTAVSSSTSASSHAHDVSPRSVIVNDAGTLLFEPASSEHSPPSKKRRDSTALSPTSSSSSNKRLKESSPSSSSISRSYDTAAAAVAAAGAVENVGRCTKVEKATSSNTATTTTKESHNDGNEDTTTMDLTLKRVANFPGYLNENDLKKRHCVMCGVHCWYNTTQKGDASMITTYNKRICNSCTAAIWKFDDDSLIKWCVGSRSFRSLQAFGDSPQAKTCLHCRNRQRDNTKAYRNRKRIK